MNISRVAVVLTHDVLDPAAIESEVQVDAAGAVVSFIGTTRNQHEGKKVISLEYEAQEKMAQKMLEALCLEALTKYDLCRARVQHRLGRVDIGQISVVVAVSSVHRGAAFDGCRHIIDNLKKAVPIFKKEHYSDAAPAQWIGPDGKPIGV